jgi:hypothetical protein
VIYDVEDWLRDRAGTVLVGCTGALLALALLVLGSSQFGGGADAAQTKADKLVGRLNRDLTAAQADLKIKHEKLLADLPGVDVERADRDEAMGRSVLLSLTDSSASTRTVGQTQVLLDARYAFLTPTSRTLTEFIPEWMAATGSGQRQARTYALRELTIDVSGVQGLDYTYVGMARLEPISASGSTTAGSEYVVFTYSTKHDGTVSSFEAYGVSSRTRAALVAADQQQKSAETDDTRTAAPTSTLILGG